MMKKTITSKKKSLKTMMMTNQLGELSACRGALKLMLV
jgi:hypothetical protein